MKKILFLTLLLNVLFLSSCGSDDKEDMDNKYEVSISKLTGVSWIKMTNHTNYVLSFTEKSFTLYLMEPKTGKIKDSVVCDYQINGYILTTKGKDGTDGFNNGKEIYFTNDSGTVLYFGQLTDNFLRYAN